MIPLARKKGVKMLDILITIAGIIAIILIWIMLYDSNRFVVVQHAFKDSRIRQNYRFVVIADLHNKQYGRKNEKLLSAIREQKPDAVLIAGDILTAKPGKRIDKAVDFLSRLAEQYPVYYANGNHEQRLKLYPEEYGSMARDYEQALKKAGIDRLVNRSVLLKEQGIIIYGTEIDKEYYRKFRTGYMDSDYLNKLVGKADPEHYCVMLAHNPDYFPQYAAWGADLVLAGHVHGGMVRVPGWKGIVSPAVRLFPKYDGGIFHEGKAAMLLSRGLGMHTIPIRLFNPGELLVVELQPSDTGKEVG